MRHPFIRLILITTSCAAMLVAVTNAAPLHAQGALVAPEKNPPGDIPDDQVFISYAAKGSFSLQAPEGWARTDLTNGVRFADKYGIVAASIDKTPAAAASGDVAALMQDAPGAKVTKTEEVKLAAGPALRISYLANSAANPVTGKKILLEHERYVITANGRTALLDFAAPAGADNIDQWRLMSNSFRWN